MTGVGKLPPVCKMHLDQIPIEESCGSQFSVMTCLKVCLPPPMLYNMSACCTWSKFAFRTRSDPHLGV